MRCTPVSLDLALEMGSSAAVTNGHAPVIIGTASTGMDVLRLVPGMLPR